MAWQSWDFSTSNSTLIDGANIYAGSIMGSCIAANTITGNNIKAGSIDVTNLNFTPLANNTVIASINASSEALRISGSKINIDGTVTFAAGYAPSDVVGTITNLYGASADQTKIDGGKIYTGSILADSLAAGSVTAEKLTVGATTRVNLCANGHFGTSSSYGTSAGGWTLGAGVTFVAGGGTYTIPGGGTINVPMFTTTASAAVIAEQYITVLPGNTYTVVGLLFLGGGATKASIRVLSADGSTRVSTAGAGVIAGTKVPNFYAAADHISSASDTATAVSRWQLVAYKVTVPPLATQLRLQVVLETGTGTSQVYATGIQLYADTMNEAGTTLDGISYLKGIAYGGDVSGNYSALSVRALQGRSVSTTAPSDTQVMSWSTNANAWTPTNPESLLIGKAVVATSFSGSGSGLTGTAPALTAGAANSVAWANVSGKPTAVSTFVNDAGYIAGINSAQVTTALGYTPANKAGDTFTGSLTAPAITVTNAGRADLVMTNSSGPADQKRWDWSVDGISGAGTLTLAIRNDALVPNNVLVFTRSANNVSKAMFYSSMVAVGNLTLASLASGLGTDARCICIKNAGADTYFGAEGAAAGAFFNGSVAYDSVIYTSTPMNFIQGGVSKLRITPTLSTMATSLSLNGSLITNANQTGMIKLRDVAFYTSGSSGSTGTIKIALPKSWTSTMMRVTIDGYDFSGNGAWQIVVSGYTYAGNPCWINAKYYTSGQPPFSTVRVAHDGTYCCILLGSTSTSLDYPKISVSEVMLGHSNFDTSWATGWTITRLTSESGLSCITTPDKLTSSFGAINASPAGITPDPCGFISVTLPADTNSYGYYSLTRCGVYAWQMGIDTSNRFVIGRGSAGNLGVITNSWFLISESTTTVNNNLQVNGTITGVGSGLTGTAASLTAGAVSSITGSQVINALYQTNNTDWYRTEGAKGIYFATYGAGICPTAQQFIQTYNSSSLQVNGQLYATGNITAYYSDARLKENIKVIPNALDKVLALRGVTFNANAKAVEVGYTDTSEQVGVIAQEVQAVLPQVVTYAPFDREMEEDGKSSHSKSGEDYLTVRYDRLAPLLIEAIKELNTKIEGLR